VRNWHQTNILINICGYGYFSLLFLASIIALFGNLLAVSFSTLIFIKKNKSGRLHNGSFQTNTSAKKVILCLSSSVELLKLVLFTAVFCS